MAKSVGKNSTFDSLVTGISTSEREKMLNKMQKGQTVGNGALGAMQQRNQDNEADGDLSSQLKKQSIFRQIFLWVMATITNSSIDDVFNKFLVSGIAKNIEKEAPGILDYKHKVLGQVFYDKLVQLKKAADFFAPALAAYEADSDSFYVLLGYIIMPSIGESIEKESDPYQYSFQKTITKEMRAALISKMDDVLESIPVQNKNEVYACVRCAEWLKQFVKIPFSRMINLFANSSENTKECLLAQMKAEFSDFARVMCNYVPITDELIQALFIFSGKKEKFTGFEALDDAAMAGTEYVNSAAGEFGVIKMFVQSVPVYDLAKVVFENSLYIPEAYGGGEDWLVRYKAKWKALFDVRWDEWNRDYKKEKLKVKILSYFGMSDFPLFPFRPWAKLASSSAPFQYELTMGFIYSFMKKVYKLYFNTLETAAVEGDFALRENRLEYTDTFNSFSVLNDNIDSFANSLSGGGEFGLQFGLYEVEDGLSQNDVQEIKVIMEDVEKEALDIINLFGKSCRSIIDLIGGMTGEQVTPYYGPLTNLAKIGGRENKQFRERLSQARSGIRHAYEIVKDLEPLDSFAK